MGWRRHAVVGAIALLALAAPARADDVSDVKQELEALKRKVRELEGSSLTQDEINVAVNRYFENAPPAMLVGGGGADGKAGWTSGKKPYIKEGDNKLEFAFRNQVRYEWFGYSDDAVGVVVDEGPEPDVVRVSGNPPRDRSGFEIERLYFGLDGTVFCPDISFKLELNFDNDSGTGVEKRYAFIDWKFAGEHHVRAGYDKVCYSGEENHSSSVLAFVDRSIVTKAFEIGFDGGIALWGHFGPGADCPDGCPKMFMYKFQVMNGEGRMDRGSLWDNARDNWSDQVLFAAAFEWTPTCKDWKMDEVDNRACDKRGRLDLSIGLTGYYENDDDLRRQQWGGLAVRGSSSATADRWGANLYVRGQWNGLSWIVEGYSRTIEYTGGSTSPEQSDYGAHAMVHYRFANTNWGVGVRYGVIWLDDDYLSRTISGTTVDFEDTIQEAGVVVNYFFFDHNNKLSADVNYVMDNSGVTSSSAGYLSNASTTASSTNGVVIEDGFMVRVQWQLNF